MLRFSEQKLLHESVDFEAHLRVEAGGRLVEKEQRGVVDQAHRDGEALFLASAQSLVESVALFFELQAAEQHAGVHGSAVERTEKMEGLDHPNFVRQVGGLQANADAVFQLPVLLIGVEPENADFAGGSLANAFENFDGGCFAGAVGAEKTEDFAGVDFEVNAADGSDVAIRLSQAPHEDCVGISHHIRLTKVVARIFNLPTNSRKITGEWPDPATEPPG